MFLFNEVSSKANPSAGPKMDQEVQFKNGLQWKMKDSVEVDCQAEPVQKLSTFN